MSAPGSLVVGNDQLQERMVIYDLSRIPEGETLEEGEVLSFPSGHAAGMKYRENTVFGDVFLIGGTISSMLSYPSGEVLWSTDRSGNNTHSVEILPSGNFVLANSSGNDIRLFYTSALLQGDKDTAAEYVSYPFGCTHGVLFDPVYECLWVYGEWDLAAYRIVGDGTSQRLEPIEGKKWSLAEFGNSGHDLAPDLTDSRYLFCTPRTGALRFDKETGIFQPLFSDEAVSHFKSFTQSPDGSFVFTAPGSEAKRKLYKGWWKSDWCTDFIGILRRTGDGSWEEERYYSENSAFYKSRAFFGRYL